MNPRDYVPLSSTRGKASLNRQSSPLPERMPKFPRISLPKTLMHRHWGGGASEVSVGFPTQAWPRHSLLSCPNEDPSLGTNVLIYSSSWSNTPSAHPLHAEALHASRPLLLDPSWACSTHTIFIDAATVLRTEKADLLPAGLVDILGTFA